MMYQQPEQPSQTPEQPQAMYPTQQQLYAQPGQPAQPQMYAQPQPIYYQPMPPQTMPPQQQVYPQQPMPGYQQGYPAQQPMPGYPQQAMYQPPQIIFAPVINNQSNATAIAANVGVGVVPRRRSNTLLRVFWFIFIGCWAGFYWSLVALILYLIPPTKHVGEWMGHRIQKAFFWE